MKNKVLHWLGFGIEIALVLFSIFEIIGSASNIKDGNSVATYSILTDAGNTLIVLGVVGVIGGIVFLVCGIIGILDTFKVFKSPLKKADEISLLALYQLIGCILTIDYSIKLFNKVEFISIFLLLLTIATVVLFILQRVYENKNKDLSEILMIIAISIFIVVTIIAFSNNPVFALFLTILLGIAYVTYYAIDYYFVEKKDNSNVIESKEDTNN